MKDKHKAIIKRKESHPQLQETKLISTEGKKSKEIIKNISGSEEILYQ
jgi:hypothetical protein